MKYKKGTERKDKMASWTAKSVEEAGGRMQEAMMGCDDVQCSAVMT